MSIFCSSLACTDDNRESSLRAEAARGDKYHRELAFTVCAFQCLPRARLALLRQGWGWWGLSLSSGHDEWSEVNVTKKDTLWMLSRRSRSCAEQRLPESVLSVLWLPTEFGSNWLAEISTDCWLIWLSSLVWYNAQRPLSNLKRESFV